MVLEAARRIGAHPTGMGLWYLPGYPELTTNQMLQIAGQRTITVYSVGEALLEKPRP